MRIIQVGDRDQEVLYKPAKRVNDFNSNLHGLLDDMLQTMRQAQGVGLAAPQVGISLRIAVIEYYDEAKATTQLIELINPEVIKAGGVDVGPEGCLSIPSISAGVQRATVIVVRYQDRQGKECRLKVYDQLARIIQHEIDHLQGVLMTSKAQYIQKIRRYSGDAAQAMAQELLAQA